MVLWSLLSLSPDLDVIGFSLGVKYEDEWGHRGATHSLVFSGVIGAATGLTATLIGRAGIQVGGRANEVCWVYTRSRNGGYYRAREVCFARDRVADVIRQWHRD